MAAVDWKLVKTEYVTTNTSYRKLAAKYNIPKTTLEHRAKTEKWFDTKRQYRDRVEAKTIKAAEDQAVDYKVALYELAYKVAMQIGDLTDGNSLAELAVLGILPRQITGAIKDLEDILHVKSDEDIKEQQARIKKLQKDADGDAQGDKTIQIVIAGDGEEYSG